MKPSKVVVVIFLILTASFLGLLLQTLLSIPKIDSLESYSPSESTTIFLADGSPLARFHSEENRRVVPISKISPFVINSVVAKEDERFYNHHGVDIQGIFRATFKNLLYGRIVEGGSTITQQLARNIFLTRQRSIVRKVAEIILAIQL